MVSNISEAVVCFRVISIVRSTMSPGILLRMRRGTLIGASSANLHTRLIAGRNGILRSMYSFHCLCSSPRRDTVLLPPGSTTA